MGILVMPPAFPEAEFRAFGQATRPFFPRCLDDNFKRRELCDFSWQAVRHRYRICSERNDEFKSLLLANPGARWQGAWEDQELSYRLESCIYTFFMSGL